MRKQIHTLDGGKISELERLGFESFDFLSLEEGKEGDTEKMEEMKKGLENLHLSYFLAGSNITCTNTFQVNLHSLRERNISIERGNEILDTYIDIAYNSVQRFRDIRRNKNSFIKWKKCRSKSVNDHLIHFQKVRTALNVVHPNDIFNVSEYMLEFDLIDRENRKVMEKIRRSNEYCVSFSNGPYNSAFRDFSEYSGVLQKNKGPDPSERKKKRNVHTYDIEVNIPSINKHGVGAAIPRCKVHLQHSNRSMIQMTPRSGMKSKEKCNWLRNWKLFNYGIEYYIDVSDMEVISNCKLKLECFTRNREKLHFFSLTTSSNVREIFTFYNFLKYYGNNFRNSVIINIFCNDIYHIGCSIYSFFDIICILLYLDAHNKYIYAIGLNCVNIEYVYDIFLPFKKYLCPYKNINVNMYRSENQEFDSIMKTVLNDLNKNRYIYDVNLFCSPNKSLQRVTYDYNTNHVNFETTSKKINHVYNYLERWIDLGINGFGGCCYYNPYDISLIDYKLSSIFSGGTN
ncbi:homocysteine S-methyltransferase, putative [Plasmodium ovale]|nr:homocysteine S-methyltransferase, putative [Plasmodium ovale]